MKAGSNSKSASTNFDQSTDQQTTNRQDQLKTNKNIKAVGLALLTSFCCGFSLLSNLVLAIILRKLTQIAFCLFLIICAIYIGYVGMKKEEKIESSLSSVVFNDTIHVKLFASETHNPYDQMDVYRSVESQLKNYFIDKYSPWLEPSDIPLSAKKNVITLSAYISTCKSMAGVLIMHTFDTIVVDSQIVLGTDLNTLIQTPAPNDESFYTGRDCRIYLPDSTMRRLFDADIEKLKDAVTNIKMEKEGKNVSILFLGLIFVVSFVQSIYLWIKLFNRNNESEMVTGSATIDTPTFNQVSNAPSKKDKQKKDELSQQNSTGNTIPADRLNINSVDIYSFLAISVMTYSQALLIITERNDNGKYKDMNDLIERNKLDPKIADALASKIYFGA